MRGECKAGFTYQLNQNAEGAIPFPDVTSLYACATTCREAQVCVGFDFDRNSPPHKSSRCWIHVVNEMVVKPQHAVDHYVKEDCAESRYIVITPARCSVVDYYVYSTVQRVGIL